MSDFWKTLAGNSSTQLLTGSMDSLLSGRAHGEDFEKMRVLTDVYREANALELPVEAGTKVSFLGTLGAYMGYENPPRQNSVGEVVSVKSANGDVTYHEGKVFVQWDDGEFRSIHAEHLRLASVKSEKTAKEHSSPEALKQYLKDHPGADKSKHTVKKDEKANKKDEKSSREPSMDEINALMLIKSEDVKSLKMTDDVLEKAFNGDKHEIKQFRETLDGFKGHVDDDGKGGLPEVFKELDEWIEFFDEDADAKEESPDALPFLKSLRKKVEEEIGAKYNIKDRTTMYGFESMPSGKTADIKQQFEKIKGMAKEKPDNDFLKSLLKQMADKGFAPTDKQMAVVKKIEDEIKQQGQMKKELKTLDKKVARTDVESPEFQEWFKDWAASFTILADHSDGLINSAPGARLRSPRQWEKSVRPNRKRNPIGWMKAILKHIESNLPYHKDFTRRHLPAIEKDLRLLQRTLQSKTAKGEFDAADIGKKQNGPLVTESEDKKIMDHFGQGDLHELSDIAKSAAKPLGNGRNGYIAYYKRKQVEVMADTKLEAQEIAAKHFRARKTYEVSVVLAEKDGRQVIHSPVFASEFRVASLGDLTDFLKSADGQLIHRSTNDLWSVAADDNGFTITRLFDDNGDPLKG